MATRLYIHHSTTYPVPGDFTPQYNTDWDYYTSGYYGRSFITTTKRSSVQTYTEGYKTSGITAPVDILMRQYVSMPLEAQTISGTFKGQLQCCETVADTRMSRAIIVKVVSEDGATVRGVLLSHFPSSLVSEWYYASSTYQNRNFPPSSELTSVVCQKGDRIVIEVGTRSFNSNYGYSRFYVDDTSASDLPENETQTTIASGWFEFSVDIDFVDRIDVCNIIGQVEYVVPPSTEFWYDGTQQATVTPSSSTVREVSKSTNVPVSIGVSGFYWLQGPGEFVHHGGMTITVNPSSQAIAEFIYDGAISCGMSVTSSARYYDVFYVNPNTGNGIVDISFLINEAFRGNVSFSLDPTADNYYIRYLIDKVGSGGMEIGGEGTYAFTGPGQDDLVADGSPFLFGGGSSEYEQPLYEFVQPAIPGTDNVVGSGGLVITAPDYPPRQSFITPISGIGNVVNIIASGGIEIGGVCEISWTGRSTAIVGSGGLAMGGQIPAVVRFVEPEDTTDEVVADATPLLFGGGGEIRFTDPEVDDPTRQPNIAPREYDGILRMGGDGVTGWVQPLVIAKQGSGGFVIGGGMDIEAQAHTWVLTGSGLEASLYTGFDFNSYASLDGKSYAAGPEGIYLIGGNTDSGKKIVSGLRLGPTNFMLKNKKYIRSVALGECGESVQVRFFVGDKEAITDVIGGRADGNRDIYGEQVGIDIAGFDTLENIDIVAVVAAHKR